MNDIKQIQKIWVLGQHADKISKIFACNYF